MKRIAWSAWLALALLLLAACGRQQQTPAGAAAVAGAPVQPEVTVYLSPT